MGWKVLDGSSLIGDVQKMRRICLCPGRSQGVSVIACAV